jgi:hypothetical protein
MSYITQHLHLGQIQTLVLGTLRLTAAKCVHYRAPSISKARYTVAIVMRVLNSATKGKVAQRYVNAMDKGRFLLLGIM